MHRPLAFGRPHEQEDARASCKLVNPWPQRCRDLGETGGSTSGRCVCRKAGACAYAAVVEASRFRAEATRKQQRRRPLLQREGARSGWDCGSSLYDSFELNAFSNELGHCLAEELRCNEATARAPLLAAPPPMSRRSTGCNPQFKLPACFPIPRNILPSCFGGERPRPIQLGKRKQPSMHEAFHRVSKAARRCFALPWSQAGLDHQHAQVYHHHMHHYSLQRAVGDVDDGTNGSMVAAKLLKNFQEEEARACLSPRTLAALRGEINRRQRTSIKYHG